LVPPTTHLDEQIRHYPTVDRPVPHGFRAGDRGGTIVVMITDSLGPRLAQTRDVAAVVGLLATLEGELMVALQRDALPDWAAPLAHRLGRDGLLGEYAGQREVRQALNDLNHRLRYVLGEYDEPIAPLPVP
jgi:hypothetical protein